MVLWIIVSSVLFHALQVSLITTERGDVRLVGGTSRCAGVVEMKHQEDWRPVNVYSRTWTPQLSSVVCRQLGCGSDGSHWWKGGYRFRPVWEINSSCKGSESALMECRGRVGDYNSPYSVDLTCSVHGGWTGWSSWSQCSTSCIPEGRASTRTRSRSCTNPAPSSSGNSCVGDAKETGRCDHLTSCRAPFSQCGRAEPAGSSVVAGRGSVAGTHPWQVSLQVKDEGSSEPFEHHCGGVLIAPCWVLTAAHCINSSMEMQVVLGGVYLNKTEESDQVIPVVRDIVHPDYRKSDFAIHNDVALLQLNATYSPLCAMETRYVKTACLPNQLFPDDMECVITGWGSTKEGSKAGSNRLMETNVTLISKQSCTAPNVYGNGLDDSMICAGYMQGGVDTCQRKAESMIEPSSIARLFLKPQMRPR